MVMLGIDTSTSAIAVALGRGHDVIDRRARIDARGHSEHLAPLIADLLRDNGLEPRDLSAVVVGNGPGPFTGLRVGMVTALTMGHALGVPVHGVCSLDALALQSGGDGELLVAADARRKEVYWALYAVASARTSAQGRVDADAGRVWRGGLRVERLQGPAVARPADLPTHLAGLPVVGRGPVLHRDAFAWGPHDEATLDVDAGALLRLASTRLAAGEVLPVEPLYLRRPDALTTAERAAR